MQLRTARYGGFQIFVRDGQTRDLVTELPLLDQRTVILAHPEDHSVVLGSTQPIDPEHQLRCASAGFALNRRRSGGGAVVVDPFEVIWIDLFLPSADPLFVRDVRKGAFWVGDLWASALLSLGNLSNSGDAIAVHHDGVVATTWSKECCFAGLGPGEVTIGQRKVVGLSQRRERAGAWFFTLAYRSLDASRDARLLAQTPNDVESIADDLQTHVGVIDHPRSEVEQAVLKALAQFDS